MKISNLGLRAFTQAASDLNITQAARNLGLTQSALSQRIALLEKDLEVTLFIREPRGLRLTESGEKLLRFSSVNQQMENDLLLQLQGSQEELAGTLRVAAYSSILRSVVMPSLAGFLRKHPKVHVDFQSYEMHELPAILNTVSADLIIMDYKWNKKGIAEMALGNEEFVVIESAKHDNPHDIYLDHSPQDNATEDFFSKQPKAPKSYRRSFMGDVYGIIDGVEMGLGRAVMSKHLIEGNKRIQIMSGYNVHKRSVNVHYFEQPYYSRIMKTILAELHAQAPQFF